jgi:nicotinamide-nucleotide adenylyltransferase
VVVYLRRVLFPGRFQPFHNGHYEALIQLINEYDEVVIAVGSAQDGFTCKNPFTGGERMEMIDYLLRSRGVRDRAWIIPAPDIHMPPAWATFLLSITPRVEAVASGNPQVLYLYEWLGFKTKRIKLVEPEKYHGSRIRELIVQGRDEWRDLLPREVVEFIDSIRGVERIRRLCLDEHSGNRW